MCARLSTAVRRLLNDVNDRENRARRSACPRYSGTPTGTIGFCYRQERKNIMLYVLSSQQRYERYSWSKRILTRFTDMLHFEGWTVPAGQQDPIKRVDDNMAGTDRQPRMQLSSLNLYQKNLTLEQVTIISFIKNIIDWSFIFESLSFPNLTPFTVYFIFHSIPNPPTKWYIILLFLPFFFLFIMLNFVFILFALQWCMQKGP